LDFPAGQGTGVRGKVSVWSLVGILIKGGETTKRRGKDRKRRTKQKKNRTMSNGKLKRIGRPIRLLVKEGKRGRKRQKKEKRVGLQRRFNQSALGSRFGGAKRPQVEEVIKKKEKGKVEMPSMKLFGVHGGKNIRQTRSGKKGKREMGGETLSCGESCCRLLGRNG